MPPKPIRNFVREIFTDTYDFYEKPEMSEFDFDLDPSASRVAMLPMALPLRGKFKMLPMEPRKPKYVKPRTLLLQDFQRYSKGPEPRVNLYDTFRKDEMALHRDLDAESAT